MGAEKILAPILDPFHRTAEHFRACRNARIFRIDGALGAKTAAHIGRDDVHLVVVEVEHVQEPALDAMRALGGNVNRVGVRDSIVARHQPAAFHEKRPAAVNEQPLAHHMGSACECRVGVADRDRHPRRDIRFRVRMGERTAGHDRGGAIRHSCQRLVIHLHQRGGILRDMAAVGHHDRDRLAHIDGFLADERIRHMELGDGRGRHEQRQRVLLHRLGQIREAEHQMHALQGFRCRHIDAADFGMRIAAADEGRMEGAG